MSSTPFSQYARVDRAESSSSPPLIEFSNEDSESSSSRLVTYDGQFGEQLNSIASTSSSTQPATSIDLTTSNNNFEETEHKRCWICFGEDSDSEGKWVKACRCSLISHEECLLNWITEKQRNTALRKVRCPQCKTVYHLAEQTSYLLKFLTVVDSTIQSSIPYFTIFGVTFAVAITNIHYGAYATITMVGLEEGERLLEEPWSWRICFTLPLVPVFLIFSRARFADPVMPLIPMLFIRMNQLRLTMPPNPSFTISLLPWARIIYNWSYQRAFGRLEQEWRSQLEPYINPTEIENGENGNIRPRNDQDVLDRLDRSNAGRKIVGALCLPFISAMVGSFLGKFPFVRGRIPDTFHRNILGGCLFIVFKDIMTLTYKYQRAKHRRTRHVREYSEFANESRQ
ncbi:hypothetical protein RhiirA5_360396 [Rhizophagus irregularis]|uniref:Uncharacterized protein n=3 Tax=Rhizophagus irregularis TaxID=588596 RepID=A0A2I1GLE0_9GLOM|nr:hypothetical protein GLOIN_2v1490455 [Rhizophagus irregularis DAOM 181602=DAOM 197198]EXX53001.1 hypothetical protein RirG_248010 [Rhizophagus irregularis DAOM 197198w]PKC06326.1 hypothetical protein RhiirA5_360396 [Rhizophagus irregularis]PKC62527.1 hypothetical protein RhiirA1_423704 [Rhizophagus irregularis]PKK67939.1 hypothetical protein RhiirC2_751044 [Rhizophagus irregularis]PKY25379.1 hypothetical protein RhiirB3_414050 [Rhizophagus irregularis]|eukprot:XP_025190089.1 hypothetical protein GLOIN_2v1490455 [Rhizophagus irregularis DAOM 181602=DAOM 197198]